MEECIELTLKDLEVVVGGFKHHAQRLAYRERIINKYAIKEQSNETNRIGPRGARSCY
jgi:hypothetical protein